MVVRPSPSLRSAVAPGVRVERIEPIQRRIPRNRLKFALFMLAFTSVLAASLLIVLSLLTLTLGALVLAVARDAAITSPGDTASSLPGVLFAVLAAAALASSWAWSVTRLLRSERWLIDRLGARMPQGGTLLPTKSVLRDIAIAAGLPKTPRFYVIDTDGVNAFVLGRSAADVRVGVTRGMLERVPVDAQRAVFANLIARVLSADTLWATAVSALVGPVWAMRDYDLGFEPKRKKGTEGAEDPTSGRGGHGEDWRAGAFITYGLAVVVSEVLSWYHREAAWTAAEKADAEGMMLLKDPRSMLEAIEHVLERDNHVPSAGDAYSQLFFCWAGFGFAPEQDPEMRRVARLRETLGAEGAAYQPRPNVAGWPVAPRAPRLDLAEEPVAERVDTTEPGTNEE